MIFLSHVLSKSLYECMVLCTYALEGIGTISHLVHWILPLLRVYNKIYIIIFTSSWPWYGDHTYAV